MKQYATRTYELDGVEFSFDHEGFNKAFKHKAKQMGDNLTDLLEEVASVAHVTSNSVKAWRYGNNAPSDIEIVRTLEREFGMAENALLVEREASAMSKLTEKQVESVSRVYGAVSDFLYMLDKTDGCVWRGYRVFAGTAFSQYLTPSPEHPADEPPTLDGERLAEAGYDWTCHILEREWPLIGSHPIYSELAEFMDGTMLEIWNGKTDPDYRFHYAGKYESAEGEPYEGYSKEYGGWIGTVEADKEIRHIIMRYL